MAKAHIDDDCSVSKNVKKNFAGRKDILKNMLESDPTLPEVIVLSLFSMR